MKINANLIIVDEQWRILFRKHDEGWRLPQKNFQEVETIFEETCKLFFKRAGVVLEPLFCFDTESLQINNKNVNYLFKTKHSNFSSKYYDWFNPNDLIRQNVLHPENNNIFNILRAEI